jgi:small subunit ribosomal protein S6
MRRYETIVIVDPDLSEPERNQRFDKILDLINQMKGALIESEDWGSKRLAYEIRKKTRGHYMRFDFCGTGELVAELERNCRIDDKFLKYMTIILQDNADPERIKVELEESRAKKAAEEASRVAQTEQDAANADNSDDTDDDSDDDSNEEDN